MEFKQPREYSVTCSECGSKTTFSTKRIPAIIKCFECGEYSSITRDGVYLVSNTFVQDLKNRKLLRSYGEIISVRPSGKTPFISDKDIADLKAHIDDPDFINKILSDN